MYTNTCPHLQLHSKVQDLGYVHAVYRLLFSCHLLIAVYDFQSSTVPGSQSLCQLRGTWYAECLPPVTSSVTPAWCCGAQHRPGQTSVHACPLPARKRPDNRRTNQMSDIKL